MSHQKQCKVCNNPIIDGDKECLFCQENKARAILALHSISKGLGEEEINVNELMGWVEVLEVCERGAIRNFMELYLKSDLEGRRRMLKEIGIGI